MDTTRRQLTKQEMDVVLNRLVALRDKDGSLLIGLADRETVEKSLITMGIERKICVCYEANVFIGILVFDVGYFWWSKELMLSEILVLCVSDTYRGFGRVACDLLDSLSKQYKCRAILAGCIFQQQPKFVQNTYQKFGYTAYPAFTKLE